MIKYFIMHHMPGNSLMAGRHQWKLFTFRITVLLQSLMLVLSLCLEASALALLCSAVLICCGIVSVIANMRVHVPLLFVCFFIRG